MELEKSWASAMQQDHSDFAKRHIDRKNSSISPQRRQRFRPMWRVREHMAFLIRNLQFYIQVTCGGNFSLITSESMQICFHVRRKLEEKHVYVHVSVGQ